MRLKEEFTMTRILDRFNTASGMRSHATHTGILSGHNSLSFQYRKRYEVTCDGSRRTVARFAIGVSIPQAV